MGIREVPGVGVGSEPAEALVGVETDNGAAVGELATGIDGTGEALRAWGPAGVAQAPSSPITARQVHRMPMQRTLNGQGYFVDTGQLV